MPDYALYIHWPFCLAKCPYCDFNSHVFRGTDETSWRYAYKAEMEFYKKHFDIGHIATIFFGGGTPSLMSPKLVNDILQDAEKIFGFATHIEISLEANPTSAEAQKFKDYRDAGITRLSMGIQALNDPDLKRLGRTHDSAEAIKAFEIAKTYFDNLSFDLIYARQNQTVSEWEKELKQAADLAVDHISLYQLTIEQDTPFAAWYKRGKISIPDDETAEEMYFLTSRVLEDQGYDHYEISNFARQSKECQHNKRYWMYKPYIGIGPGAHGRILDKNQMVATIIEKDPKIYLQHVLKTEKPAFTTREPLSYAEMDLEYILMGLRINDGINIASPKEMKLNEGKISDFCKSGHLFRDHYHLSATRFGRPILNHIISEII
ncbi:MAG: radical SAM family heme chaperone HemW [Pseudomonadota bacterium]